MTVGSAGRMLNGSYMDARRSARSRRVMVLLIGILVLSAADLAITLVHLKSVGMMEANPIAAYLIRTTDSPWALTVYKVVTVGICISLLFLFRRRAEGEIAAWFGAAVLAAVSIMWHNYSEHFDDPHLCLVVDP